MKGNTDKAKDKEVAPPGTQAKADAKTSKDNGGMGGALGFFILFALWYAFNAGYNVTNAHAKIFPFPIAISVVQLVIGLVYAVPLWVLGVRDAPRLSFSDIFRLLPIAALNAIGHTTTVVAMFQKGGGSFAHVIKASEPVVSVVLGMLINGQIPKPLTAASLLPISYGVAYASTLGKLDVATMAKELTSVTAVMAMIGNIAFALRSIARKNLSKDFKVGYRGFVLFLFCRQYNIPCFLPENRTAPDSRLPMTTPSLPSSPPSSLRLSSLCMKTLARCKPPLRASLMPRNKLSCGIFSFAACASTFTMRSRTWCLDHWVP